MDPHVGTDSAFRFTKRLSFFRVFWRKAFAYVIDILLRCSFGVRQGVDTKLASDFGANGVHVERCSLDLVFVVWTNTNVQWKGKLEVSMIAIEEIKKARTILTIVIATYSIIFYIF